MMNSKTILLIFAIVCLCLSNKVEIKELENKIIQGSVLPNEEQAFEIYSKLHNKHGHKQDRFFKNYFTNIQKIHELNKQGLSWTAGINKFTFMSEEEFMSQYLGAQECAATAYETLKQPKKTYDQSTYPKSFDWRDNLVVSAVKDQQDCGSCWAFATTGALESHWAIKTNTSPQDLSEQQLMDCSKEFKNFGCNGGLPSQAFEYLKYSNGINSENVYSYLVDTLPSCQQNVTNNVAYVKGGAVNITFKDEAGIQDAVFNQGPVAVAFQVLPDFQQYVSGIYSSKKCTGKPEDVNHAVLAVGWGKTILGEEYWIIKNSWSTQWGEEGYFRMKKGVNMCGIADCASYPDIDGAINYRAQEEL